MFSRTIIILIFGALLHLPSLFSLPFDEIVGWEALGLIDGKVIGKGVYVPFFDLSRQND
jgi:hypothetical protein